jgi:integrase
MEPETDAFFLSERHGLLSRKTVWFMIGHYGERAGLAVEAHPPMLHHASGFALADQGADTRLIQDDLGHRNMQHASGIRRPIRHGLRDCGGDGRQFSSIRDLLCLLTYLLRYDR